MTNEEAIELLIQMRDSEWMGIYGQRTAVYTDDAKEAYNMAIKALEGKDTNVPTSAQPERKTGRWVRNSNGTWSCDQCQSWVPDEQHYYARFCLYCGAKMEVEHETD